LSFDNDAVRSIRVYDSNTGESVNHFSWRGRLWRSGYSAPGCMFVVTDTECIIKNFIEDSLIFQEAHDNKIYSGFGNTFVLAQHNKLLLIDIMNASKIEIQYDDELHHTAFNAQGDKIIVAHGAKVDVLNSATGERLARFDLNGCTAYRTILSPDGAVSVTCLNHDRSIIVIHDACNGRFIAMLGYCDDVKSMQFDEDGTIFVVTTENSTHAYDVKYGFQELKQ
jgi:aspartate 1-decarboxylase